MHHQSLKSCSIFLCFRLGYGTINMQPDGGTLCGLGPEDVSLTTPKDEYFATLEIVDFATRELKLTQFNQQDYTLPRAKAGYICQLEGDFADIFHFFLWLIS